MNTPSSNKPATTMADLLRKNNTTFVTLKKGDIIRAIVSKITPTEILLDVNTKTEALVLEKDRKILRHLLHLLKVGDTVEASVLSPESDMGYPVVSLRRFADNATWQLLGELLKSGDKITVQVTETTKGGFLIEAENGIAGFLPKSHISPDENVDDLVGRTIKASVVDLNREQNKVIFSEKGILTMEEFKEIMTFLKKGERIKGIISGITSFGLFVTIQTAIPGKSVEGLVHISEVSWEKIDDLAALFTLGEDVEAIILGNDAQSKRVDLSMKRLSSDPFEEIVKAYPIDKKITGEVTAIDEAGVTVALTSVGSLRVEGLIRKEKISPTTRYDVGQKVTATVIQVDSKRRKVLLTPVLLEKPLMYR